jgi:uncharacterized BrkB/YihY/UPF0761 family membrane protein
MFELSDFLFPALVVIAFVAGVVLSTKIKDVFKGIPSDLRTALDSVEADAANAVKSAKKTVVTTAVASALTSVKVAAPAAAAAPVAAAAPAAPAAPTAVV